jgi:hypothetical protein
VPFDAGRTIHALCPPPHDGETDPGAGIDAVGVQALEDAEDPLLMLGRDPDAIVLNP